MAELIMGALLPVAAVLLLAYWCSRYLGKRWGSGQAGSYFKVLDRLQIGPNRSLMLVKLQDRIYLIGSSEKGIELLDKPEDIQEMPHEPKQALSFQDMLRAYGAAKDKKGGK